MGPTGRLSVTAGAGTEAPRDWWTAVRRGLACRCPACGRGRVFGRFLKVEPQCAACGEELHHHRADDLPPYLVITIVGHIVAGGILAVETAVELPIWQHMVVWPLLTLALCFGLMQPVKGAVVAHQWAFRMHGFGGADDEEATLRPRTLQEVAR
ncbi:DUF983 domain-containing protein [Chelatococcus sp. SYSU_G07232]|uniref:DUF983 domain-containing protein n=1 Tax=Chelatococcus albus TaxID=3047466 RepID=A0ABT7ACV3_9HYPH|nr:DUF983 domain-containing protein [Chelatococcus sp. SYSU_G07232]MDJ1157198.1 DUF983 domain-containing protein [Chelatococcus sp. SYSU_G07232]